MDISPDSHIFFQSGIVVINATLVYTWIVMLLLTVGSWLVTRSLTSGPEVSRWQVALETIVSTIQSQIAEVITRDRGQYLPFIGTLFLFISVSNLLSIIPGFETPAVSLSTTAALALCVFFAVPFFGITQLGIGRYLRRYIEPSFIMLPFQIIGEVSRTFALAVRLFGNMLSGSLIVAVLLLIVPLLVPVLLQAFGLLIGQIQAYIFAVLALVYIGSAVQVQDPEDPDRSNEKS